MLHLLAYYVEPEALAETDMREHQYHPKHISFRTGRRGSYYPTEHPQCVGAAFCALRSPGCGLL